MSHKTQTYSTFEYNAVPLQLSSQSRRALARQLESTRFDRCCPCRWHWRPTHTHSNSNHGHLNHLINGINNTCSKIYKHFFVLIALVLHMLHLMVICCLRFILDVLLWGIKDQHGFAVLDLQTATCTGLSPSKHGYFWWRVCQPQQNYAKESTCILQLLTDAVS